jgi:hypothetical protein
MMRGRRSFQLGFRRSSATTLHSLPGSPFEGDDSPLSVSTPTVASASVRLVGPHRVRLQRWAGVRSRDRAPLFAKRGRARLAPK